jgi:hypothetical protein
MRTGRPTDRAAALALAAVLTGCSGQSRSTPASSGAGRCPVTLPSGKVRVAGGEVKDGDRSLGVELWPSGELVAGRLPDGSEFAEVKPDGSIEAKLGWWRGVEARLRIEGRRLDASAPPLRVDVPDGYGSTGFQPTGLTFPTVGCWKVSGSLGRARLTFVVRVIER